MLTLYPSLIAGDLLGLREQIKNLDEFCDGYHLDVMDFHFVHNLTMGPDFINAIASVTDKPLYVHLMVDDPAAYFNLFKLRLGDTISFHIETCLANSAACNPITGVVCPGSIDYAYAQELAGFIKKRSIKASIALKPSTSVTVTEPLLQVVNDILLMSVEPGFSGQEFLPGSFGRLSELAQLRIQKQSQCTITVDGGINRSNIKQIRSKGANSCALGSALFKGNPVEELKELKKLLKK